MTDTESQSPKMNNDQQSSMPPPHILIIGGGIVGLTLAQALRKHHPSIPCTVYERDPDPSWRGAGWGLTIHWALSTFLDLLPQELIDRLEETFVDPVASKKGDGNFLFFNLRTAEQRWRVPPNRRIRVRRESLRRLLMEGVKIEASLKTQPPPSRILPFKSLSSFFHPLCALPYKRLIPLSSMISGPRKSHPSLQIQRQTQTPSQHILRIPAQRRVVSWLDVMALVRRFDRSFARPVIKTLSYPSDSWASAYNIRPRKRRRCER